MQQARQRQAANPKGNYVGASRYDDSKAYILQAIKFMEAPYLELGLGMASYIYRYMFHNLIQLQPAW